MSIEENKKEMLEMNILFPFAFYLWEIVIWEQASVLLKK